MLNLCRTHVPGTQERKSQNLGVEIDSNRVLRLSFFRHFCFPCQC
jgi:hypothetical protein